MDVRSDMRCHHAGVSCLVWSLLPVCLSQASAQPDSVESTSIHVLLFKDCLSLFSLPVTSWGTCSVSECRSVWDLHSHVHTQDVDEIIHAHTNLRMKTISESGNAVKCDAEWVMLTHMCRQQKPLLASFLSQWQLSAANTHLNGVAQK